MIRILMDKKQSFLFFSCKTLNSILLAYSIILYIFGFISALAAVFISFRLFDLFFMLVYHPLNMFIIIIFWIHHLSGAVLPPSTFPSFLPSPCPLDIRTKAKAKTHRRMIGPKTWMMILSILRFCFLCLCSLFVIKTLWFTVFSVPPKLWERSHIVPASDQIAIPFFFYPTRANSHLDKTQILNTK